MTDWVPTLVAIQGPRYLAFVLALEADIAAGRVKPGMRLLPQRDMARRLDLSVGTISKAYAEVPRIPLFQPFLNVATQKNISGYVYWFHRQLDYRSIVKG